MITKNTLTQFGITGIFIILSLLANAQDVFINEIHYDNSGADTGEGIEVAGPAGADLADWSLVLYNGSNGTVYNTTVLSETLTDSGNGFGFLFIPIAGIQNGAPDGIALVDATSQVIQFISYEGSLTAAEGPANGLTSEDIGVAEESGTGVGFSLQLTGTGTSYEDFTWALPTVSTYGTINNDQSFGTTIPTVFINEIHYDNAGADTGEAIELAGEAATDLMGWNLVLYNGSNGSVYNTQNLVGAIPDSGNGFGFITVEISGIQNGGPDGVALVNAEGTVVQFLSYEGSFVAVGGPADGLTSEDIGVFEASDTPVDQSLQLSGEGTRYEDFTWVAPATATFGVSNNNQTLGTVSTTDNVFINEIHYDNTGADTGEGIELAGEATVDLTGWSLVLYNGSNGSVYNTQNLVGSIPDSGNGFGFVTVEISGLQNGAPDGVALVNAAGEVIQFVSYEGSFVAVGGPADGLTSEDIGVFEASDTPIGQSLQLTGEGTRYEDFTWTAPATATFGTVNNDQILGSAVATVFINEFHYDNAGSDVGEAIELAGTAGTDITGWNLVLYNGNGGVVYNTTPLTGIFENTTGGYGFISVPFGSIQNGSPDGIALVNAEGEVVQFLSYEGSFMATDGPANGLESLDIGIAEDSGNPVGNSLQLIGTGSVYEDFTWSNIPNTFGALNTGQSFGGVDPVDPELITIAAARTTVQGTKVKIQGVLTASDQFGGPAFIQDETAGIPVFDEAVHGGDTFNIGDELEIVATVGQFNEQIQLGSVTKVTLISTNNEVTPVTTTIDQLSNFEGQLVFIDAITFDIPGRLFIGNHAVSDASGTVDIRIDNNVESLIGRVKPEDTTTLTGVVGSFQGVVQVFPRFEPDLPGTKEFISQPPAGADIPRNKTLDVASWNIEFFGATQSGFGPSDVQLQKENVLQVLDSLKADIIALQEVSDIDLLANALTEITSVNYAVICSDVYSRSFEPDDGTFPPQQLCFVYNQDVIKILDEQVIFDEFYTAARTGLISDLDDYPTGSAQSFWSSGRLPYRIQAEITIEGVVDTLSIINIHGKSGSAAEDVARKEYDYRVLKDTLDTYFANEKLVLLGDYNDDVDVSIGGGTTPLQPFVVDGANYDIVSNSFSFDGLSSTVFGNAVIDHIAITNELFEPYIEDSEDLLNPEDYIVEYERTTSDHFPVETRFLYEIPVDPLVITVQDSVQLYRGYDERATALIEVSVTGGVAPYTFAWSNGATTAEVEITTEDEGELRVMVTDAAGTTSEATIVVLVEDVSCRKGWYTGVQMCYKGKSVCIPQRWVAHFEAKGFVIGDCNTNVPKREVKATPNPFRDDLSLRFDFDIATEVNVQVMNFFRQVVFEGDYIVEAGTSMQTINLSELPWGIYIVKVSDKNDPDYLKKLLVYKKL